jgi:hypothetical protein
MHYNISSTRSFRVSVVLALIIGLMCSLQPVNAEQDQVVYLPLIMGGTGSVSAEQTALDRINYYRGLAGVQLVQLHPALLSAAQNHANYDLLNYNDSSAWVNGPHGEVVGKPGFTGTHSGDRAVAAGYPWNAGWEVMGYVDDPTRSVDGLMETVFHRVVMLTPSHQYVGYGHGLSGSERVDVIDFGRGPDEATGQSGVIVYPADGQAKVSRYIEGEIPSPLPAGASYPAGHPITLQPIYGTALTVTLAELRDGSGAPVTLHPNPANCGNVCYAMIPVAPLQASTTYTVDVAGTIEGVPFDKTWSFTTR